MDTVNKTMNKTIDKTKNTVNKTLGLIKQVSQSSNTNVTNNSNSNVSDIPTENNNSNTFDKLSLQNHPDWAKVLKKNGDKTEKLVYSNKIIKINHKGKEQQRLLLITDKAIYNIGEGTNIKKGPLGKLKRRIELYQIHAITVSSISDEFVLHAPNEYDYHYKSIDKFNISKIIEYILHSTNKQDFQIVYVQQASLNTLANADEKTAKKQTVNEKFEKYWQARNALKRNGIEQEEEKTQTNFDYKKLIETLKQDVDNKSYSNKYNLDIKSDTEIFSDPNMDPELLNNDNNYNDNKQDDNDDNDHMMIPCNDYIEIGANWMQFEKLMLDSNEGHQLVLVKHIINKRYYILNVTDKVLIHNDQTWYDKFHQLSLFQNIETFKSRDYRYKNNLDFSLFRDYSKNELISKTIDIDVNNRKKLSVVGYNESKESNNDLDTKNVMDYNVNKILWNDEFSAIDFIVRKYDIITTPKCMIELTNYYSSGDLSICLQLNKQFTYKQCKYIIAQVVLAMYYLHSNMNYIIYDLKPENIYIDCNGYISISEIESLDELKINILKEINNRSGAPEYLSPEILNKDIKNLNIYSDYWSLGILTYELLVGLPPFFNDDMNEYDKYLDKGDRICIRMMQNKIMKLTTHKVEFPKNMNIKAKNFIDKLLVVDPKKRLTDFNEIKNDPFFENIQWKKLLYKSAILPFKPPKLNRFGKILSTFNQDWSGRKILNSWFEPTKLSNEQEKIFDKFKAFDDPSAFKYFAKLENQI